MSDETTPPGGDVTTFAIPADAPTAMSVSEAARMLSQARKAKTEPPKPAESAPPATAESQLAVEANAAPQTEATGETEVSDPAEVPPLALPRSWAKEQQTNWDALPRTVQEYLTDRASKDSEAVRRGQNEAAEAKRAFEAQLAQAEQIRKEYEAKIPTLVKSIEASIQNDFADVQSMADVRKLQAEDPFRFQTWQLRQMELAAAQQEQQASAQRELQEKQTAWQKYVAAESTAFEETAPEFKEKRKEYTAKAAEVLSTLGFSNDELGRLANGDDKISLYDRRLQQLLYDRIKLDEIRSSPAKAVPKEVPPVSKPGTATRAQPVLSQLETLNQKLGQAKGRQALELAAQITALKRKAGTG